MCLEKNLQDLLHSTAPKKHLAGFLANVDDLGRQQSYFFGYFPIESTETEVFQDYHLRELLRKTFERIAVAEWKQYPFSFLFDESGKTTFSLEKSLAESLGLSETIVGSNAQEVHIQVMRQLQPYLKALDEKTSPISE